MMSISTIAMLLIIPLIISLLMEASITIALIVLSEIRFTASHASLLRLDSKDLTFFDSD
jgi:hypothetical protein